MACGVCNSQTHNVRTCPYEGKRRPVGRGIPKSNRCECCGQYGYVIHRHHTRGRADDSDYLDVCNGCHLHCCHDGNTRVLARKPRVCRFMNRDSFWRAA
jgi:ribosomal protein L31